MTLWRILLVATAAEAALLGGLMGLLSLGGEWNAWLDVVNQFAPFWTAIALVGGVAAWACLARGAQRTAVAAFAAIGIVVGGARVAPDLALGFAGVVQSPPRHGSAPLRVMTFNVWSNNPDPAAALRTIAAASPDVVDLQEYSENFHSQDKAMQTLYPHRAVCPSDVQSDVEIYTRLPLLAQGCVIVDPSHRLDDPLHFVWIRVVAPDGKTATVVTTHMVWPFPPGPQERELISLAEQLRPLPSDELVLTGDFNLTPWSAAMGRLDRRLAPLSRRSHALFSWPIYLKPGIRAPFAILPIDQVFAGRAWRTVLVRPLPRSSSDHYPVLVTLYR